MFGIWEGIICKCNSVKIFYNQPWLEIVICSFVRHLRVRQAAVCAPNQTRACEMWVRRAAVWNGAKTRLENRHICGLGWNHQVFDKFGQNAGISPVKSDNNPPCPDRSLGLNLNDCMWFSESSSTPCSGELYQAVLCVRPGSQGFGKYYQALWEHEIWVPCQSDTRRKSAFWHFDCVFNESWCVMSRNFAFSVALLIDSVELRSCLAQWVKICLKLM